MLKLRLGDLIQAVEMGARDARTAADAAYARGDWGMVGEYHALAERYESALVHLNNALNLL